MTESAGAVLDAAALKAFRAYVYSPGKCNGKATRVRVKEVFMFKK